MVIFQNSAIAAKGIGRVGELIEKAGSDATLPETAETALKILAQHLEAIDASIAALDQEIAAIHAQSPISRLLASIPGVGTIAASAIAASAPDPKVFKPGRAFSASPDRRRGKIPAAAKRSPAPSAKRATGRLLVPGGALAASDCGGAAALVRAWRANGKARFTRLAGRSSRAQTRATNHRRSGQQARMDHMGRHDDRRGVSYRDFRTSMRERRRSIDLENFQFGEGETDMMNETVGIGDAGHPYPVTRPKLVSLIGTFAAGLHQIP